MESNFEYLVIPREMFELKLNPYETMILSLVKAYHKPPYCYASNKYISETLNISVRSTVRAIASLIEKGYVKQISFDGRKRILACTIKTVYHNIKF